MECQNRSAAALSLALWACSRAQPPRADKAIALMEELISKTEEGAKISLASYEHVLEALSSPSAGPEAEKAAETFYSHAIQSGVISNQRGRFMFMSIYYI